MSFGWAVVGLGRHPDLRMVPAIRQARDARLLAVCGRDVGRAKAFAQKHGAEASYDNYEALLRHPGVEAIYVASPNALHRQHAIAAARVGKHVLCEKPMALAEEDGRAMVDACRAAGVKLGVCFHLRHHPAHREMQRLIRSTAIGEVTLAEAQWASGARGYAEPPRRPALQAWWEDPELVGGGTMMGTGVHCIDLLRFFSGREVTEVSALTDGQTEARPLENRACFALRFQGGLLAQVIAARVVPDPRNDVVVYGSKARLRGVGTVSMSFGGELELTSDSTVGRTQYLKGDMYQNMVEAYQDAVRENRDPSASGEDGLRCIQITLAVFESARTGRMVRLGTP